MFTCLLSAALAAGFVDAHDNVAPAEIAISTAPNAESADKQPHDSPLEAAARRFRIQIYDSYRLDRAEFDRRRAAWSTAETNFRESGSRREDYRVLLGWLEQATYQSRSDVRGPLPAIPSFQELNASSPAGQPAIAGPVRRAADPTLPSDTHRLPIEQAPAPPRATSIAPTPHREPKVAPATPQAPRDNVVAPAESADTKPAVGETLNHIDLNVGELLARASGYSVGVRTLDSVLLDDQELDVKKLTSAIDELESLLSQRHDLLLYEQLVSDEDRAKLSRWLEFPKTTVAELGGRIAAAREGVTARTGLNETERSHQLDTLEQLSKRLARLSQK